MDDTFDRFEYIDYLRRRWRVAAVACVVALILSLGVSLIIPKRYTATASIVIEPPTGNDMRTAMAVSPVYLESLKTYESFASSDSLFARAAERFHIQPSGLAPSIESLKRQVLKVSKIRDTKVLEISATLPEPKLAQNFVQYLAEATVSLSRDEYSAADRELLDDAQKQVSEARLRLDGAQNAWAAYAVREPVDALRNDIEAGVEVQTKLRQELADAEADVAEYQERAKESSGEFAERQLPAMQARVSLLEKRTEELTRSIGDKNVTLALRNARREPLVNEVKMAQTAYDSASTRLREVRTTTGMRGERLRVIDPGIVPERPSTPNIPLNVIVALFVALLASMVYLSLAFGFRRRAIGFEPAVSRGRHA
jgi:succinoglycan biosynthesis transport protein ExoP